MNKRTELTYSLIILLLTGNSKYRCQGDACAMAKLPYGNVNILIEFEMKWRI